MMMAERTIFHIDCNAFYASVEEVLHPELRQVPLAICGDPDGRHGIILAKNERAKAYDIKTAETIWAAKRKCPDLVLAPTRHGLYSHYCEQLNALYEQYTDQVERFGIDESFLDVTGSLHLFGGNAEALAHQIRLRVTAETGLTVSVGVSYNKMFAKLGSDMKKPDAVTVIARENFRDLVWPLPVGALLMVGRATQEALTKLHIKTIGDLARFDKDALQHCLGKAGAQLWANANGLDDSPVLRVGQEPGIQSIGNGLTFRRDLLTREDIHTALTHLCDTVASRMRTSGHKCTALQLTIKDISLKVITRQKPLPHPTFLAADLVRACMELLEASWKIGAPIRMLTVTALKLVAPADTAEQISLFADPQAQDDAKQERLEKAVSDIRKKYGHGAITPAAIVRNDLGIHTDDD